MTIPYRFWYCASFGIQDIWATERVINLSHHCYYSFILRSVYKSLPLIGYLNHFLYIHILVYGFLTWSHPSLLCSSYAFFSIYVSQYSSSYKTASSWYIIFTNPLMVPPIPLPYSLPITTIYYPLSFNSLTIVFCDSRNLGY